VAITDAIIDANAGFIDVAIAIATIVSSIAIRYFSFDRLFMILNSLLFCEAVYSLQLLCSAHQLSHHSILSRY
jgi:hypothetical protein